MFNDNELICEDIDNIYTVQTRKNDKIIYFCLPVLCRKLF
jgi:hypothetical protein